MPTDKAPLSASRAPCALQHYLDPMGQKEPNHALSQGDCQMAFQHWVAYIRGNDSGYSSSVTAKEHLRCPLLWCRESFDSLASTLQHVSKCPWLPNAWYWCPYCGRPESFLASQEPLASHVRHKVQRKDSKLRRAVTFFKHLGLKSCSRDKSSESSSPHESEPFDTPLVEQPWPEMEGTSRPPELADSSSDAPSRGLYSREQARDVYEMEEAPLQELDCLPRYTPDACTAVQPYELDIEPQMRPQMGNSAVHLASSFSGVGAQFELAGHDVEPRGWMVMSPVSTIEESLNSQSIGHDIPFYADSGSVSPIYDDSDAAPPSKVVDHATYHVSVIPTHSRPLLSTDNFGSLCDAVALSTQSQTEDLREMVRLLSEEWMRRCQSSPDILLRASEMSLPFLFDTAVQTLQLFFRGVFPETFDAVFALAHVACAAAYIMHRDDGSYCWNYFFQDLLRWQLMILNCSDAKLFSHLINLLWWPQGSSSKLSCGNYHLDAKSGTLIPLRMPVLGLDGLPSAGINDLQPSRWPTEPAAMPMWDSLKDGAVIRECTSFLDGVEYADILERSKRYPTHLAWYAQNHLTNIEEMRKKIIHPLQECDGIEALHDSIDFTMRELSKGSLRSVREVEVSLISNGRSSCRSPKMLKRYLDTIASFCDHIMHEADPNWRDRCYATDLDGVLASALEMDKRQGLDHILPHHGRGVNVMSMPGNEQTSVESIPTPPSIASQTLIGPSLYTYASSTLVSGCSPQTHPSSTTSPESSFSAPSPSLLSTDVTRCALCHVPFTGSTRNRNTNLRRHMRSVHGHGNAVGYMCTTPGCSATFNRLDNLGKHIRTIHEGDENTVLRREGAGKRRRNIEGVE